MPRPLFSFAFPDAADRGVQENWDFEDASEEERDCNGDLMDDLASPYPFKRVVTVSASGDGCLAAPACDHLQRLAAVTYENIEPHRATIGVGGDRVTLTGVPVEFTCRTEAGVIVPGAQDGADIVLPAPANVPIIVEWFQIHAMRFISLRKGRDRDRTTVTWELVLKE